MRTILYSTILIWGLTSQSFALDCPTVEAVQEALKNALITGNVESAMDKELKLSDKDKVLPAFLGGATLTEKDEKTRKVCLYGKAGHAPQMVISISINK